MVRARHVVSWCCFGRVDSPTGFGSGVMIGPSHLLKVSDIVQWLPNNQAGWILVFGELNG